LTFRVFFVPLKQFLDYLELFLALKINSKKKEKKPILLEWAEPEGPTCSSPRGPRGAHRGPTGHRVRGRHGRPGHRRLWRPARIPIKGEAGPARSSPAVPPLAAPSRPP
jgi:hypothetical protein